MDSTTPTPAPTPTPEPAAGPQEAGLVIQDLDTTHDRQVTSSMGSHTIGRWSYPTRVFNGYTQYQTRDGDWVDVPAAPEDEPSSGDGTP